MSIRTRLDKANRNDVVFLAVRTLPFGLTDEVAAVDQRPGPLALRSLHGNLRCEPFGEAVNVDATGRRVGVLTISGRLIHREARSFQCQFNLTQETGFDDLPFAVVASPVPSIQTADNRGVVRQVHQRAGAEHIDDLAAANLSIWAGHQSGSSSGSIAFPFSSISRRLQAGSTSRSERCALNCAALLSSLSKSGSSGYRSR